MKIGLVKSAPPLLLAATIALASFEPNIRIDHNDIPTNWMQSPAITLGPQTSSGQPIYVAFQKDSLLPTGLANCANIMFQKSTDGGRTWLPADVLVQRGSPLAEWPDIVTDLEDNIYIIYGDNSDSMAYHYDCVRSSDGGSTWSTPVSIHSSMGWARITVDSDGNLFVAWTAEHVYSSVSTDKGITWTPRVRVDDDTVRVECYCADAYVQPGTNDYLVVADAPYHHSGGYVTFHAYLYRSTDMGQTFEPGVQLDSFGAGVPHVVADAQHMICDYTGESELPNHLVTEARTSYAPSDTWGSRVLVTELDTPYQTYYNGSKLAISADGRVHTALMIGIVTNDSYPYLAYYAYSSDHGASWSDRVLVSADTMSNAWDEDIGVDSAGHAYVVWQQFNLEVWGEIWFATNNPVGISEQPVQQPVGVQPSATALFCGSSYGLLVEYELIAPSRVRASLYDAVGRQVGVFDAGEQKPGIHRLSWNQDCEGRKLSAGAYFVLLDTGKDQARLKAVIR